MAQRPCLMLGLIAHAKHNAWVSPVCGSKKGQAVLCWWAVDPPGGVRDGLTGKWHTSETVQEKEKSLFFEEKWVQKQNPRERWSAPSLFFYRAMHRLRTMKYIDGFVCSQIDSVIAQSGFCCADDKLFLFINENFLLLRKKCAPADLTQRRDGGQCTVGVGLRRRVSRAGWVQSMCGCVGMWGGDCSGNC